jgi:hypothetical protein
MMIDRVWIGLLCIEADTPVYSLGGAKRAYVNALAMCKDVDDFCAVAVAALAGLGFQLTSVEDVEILEQRTKKYTVDPKLLVLATGLKKTGDIAFGVFHTFPSR